MDYASAITVDVSGNIYTTGIGVGDFDPGAATYSLDGGSGSDVFISKLDAAGNFVWAKHINGPIYESANSIVLDPAGNVYIGGNFEGGGDFDPGTGNYPLSGSTYGDAFVLKLNSTGTFVWAKEIDGS